MTSGGKQGVLQIELFHRFIVGLRVYFSVVESNVNVVFKRKLKFEIGKLKVLEQISK